MGRTACIDPQYLYSRAIPLLPSWTVRPVQSLSACTRVTFTFTFYKNIYSLDLWFSNWGLNLIALENDVECFLIPTSPLLSTHHVCRRSQLNLIKLNAITGWSSLHEGSARFRARNLHNTQYCQQTDIHATGWIRFRYANKRATAVTCLRPRGHLHRGSVFSFLKFSKNFYSL
jgi:hypothetical protein